MNNSEKRHLLSRCLRLATVVVTLSIAGCRSAGEIPDAVVPPMTSRFSQSGPVEVPGQQLTALQVLSESDLVQIDFAQRLQQKLSTELELTHPQLRVMHLPIRDVNRNSTAFPVPETFRDETDSTDESPPVVTETPTFDRVFQVRVTEYRPWLPMHVHLQLTILDGKSRQQLHTSRATWSVRNNQICGGCEEKPPRSHRRKQRNKCSDEQICIPSPTHNSPEALLDQIAQELAHWYGSIPISENPAIEQNLSAESMVTPAPAGL